MFIECIIIKFLKGRSICPKCDHELGVLDLIPLFSFFSLKGKCRYCKKKISRISNCRIIYRIVIFGVAYLLNANFLTQGIFNLEFLNLLFYFFITAYFVMIFVFDLKWFIIPDGLTFSAIVVTLIYLFSGTFILNMFTLDELFIRVVTAFVVFLFFFALYFFSEGKAMGFGDVKLVIFLGLLLGFPNILPALFIALLAELL